MNYDIETRYGAALGAEPFSEGDWLMCFWDKHYRFPVDMLPTWAEVNAALDEECRWLIDEIDLDYDHDDGVRYVHLTFARGGFTDGYAQAWAAKNDLRVKFGKRVIEDQDDNVLIVRVRYGENDAVTPYPTFNQIHGYPAEPPPLTLKQACADAVAIADNLTDKTPDTNIDYDAIVTAAAMTRIAETYPVVRGVTDLSDIHRRKNDGWTVINECYIHVDGVLCYVVQYERSSRPVLRNELKEQLERVYTDARREGALYNPVGAIRGYAPAVKAGYPPYGG